ncbi:MAG: cytochrome c [Gemmatimonadota bacterium]|nr:cytochrome c [Gemmatimonadota bacterium]
MMYHRISRAPAWRRSILSLACTALLLFSAVDVLCAQERGLPTQNALAGSRVFGAEGCGRCHAINGLGGTEAPDLARFPRPRTFFDLAAAMWNHLPRMVERMRELGIERPRLSERDTGDLIAFLYTLDYFDAPGDVDKGRELFRNKRCIACHQVGGDGGVVGPNLSIPGKLVAPIEIATAMWNHGSAMSEVMRERGIERPRFSATELRDLIAFLESQNPEVPEAPLHVLPGLAGDGRRLFSEKGCVQCHAVVGTGGISGPDLAERGAYRSLLAFAAAMWNKVPAMTRAMRARGLSVPQLTPSEMGDLVGYLYSVKFFAQSSEAAVSSATKAASVATP